MRVVAADPAGRQALEIYRALFDLGSARLDVVQFPDSWAPALADDLLPLGPFADPEAFVRPAREGAFVNDVRIGWPQHLAIMVLFMRSDVLGEGVTLWSQLRTRLVDAPDDGALGLSIGAADPALFPFFLDWLYGIGHEDPTSHEALATAVRMLQDLIGPVTAPGASDTGQRDATSEFASGATAALVARSTQAPSLRGSAVSDRIAATAKPRMNEEPDDTPVLTTVWFLGVPRTSAAPQEAQALAEFMTAEAQQRRAAIEFGLAPTLTAAYEDDEVVAAGPILAQIAQITQNLTPPPVDRFGLAYLDLTDQVAQILRGVLRGESDADKAADAIQQAIRRADLASN